MAKYYSIRVISGNNEEEALENLMSEKFDETDPLCDKIISADKVTVNEEPTYFLLGEEVCRLFSEADDFNEFLELLEEEEPSYLLYEFKGDVIDLLYTSHKWGDYAVLTEEEYNKLAEL